MQIPFLFPCLLYMQFLLDFVQPLDRFAILIYSLVNAPTH